MATLIPFPAPLAPTEDALAYWTPPQPIPTGPERAAAPLDKRLAALEQMYGYYAAN